MSETVNDEVCEHSGWRYKLRYKLGKSLVVAGSRIMEAKPEKQIGLTLAYLFFEIALWAIAVSAWKYLHDRSGYTSTFLYFTLIGAAVGGLSAGLRLARS